MVLSSSGGNKESITINRNYNVIEFLRREKSDLEAKVVTAQGNNPSAVGTLSNAVYLHVYVSDLSGTGSSLNSPWWLVLKQTTELHDLIEDAA